MSNDQQRLQYLVTKYATNSCTRNELLELFALVNHKANEEQLHSSLSQIWETMSETDTLPQLDKERIFNDIIDHSSANRPSSNRKWIGYAAAAILFFSLTFGLYSLKHSANNITHVSSKVSNSALARRSNKAVLTLANGSRITLNNNTLGVVAKQNRVEVKQLLNGEITYQSKDADKSVNTSFNLLSTPVGGQYAITLADGTKVWLDAVSSLRYPVSFIGKERRVELTGQAYFEVAKDRAMPFVVAVNKSEIKVYGTHFNVMGYADEANTNITLLEGSVKVTFGDIFKMLKPGQQASITRGGIGITAADGEQAIAWKNGRFNFAHEHIEMIMSKLSRWFDIEVVYQGNITKEGFVGTLPRSKSLTDVLRTLELTGLVHFKVEGRRVTVMP